LPVLLPGPVPRFEPEPVLEPEPVHVYVLEVSHLCCNLPYH
jgi:hypothetical protein